MDLSSPCPDCGAAHSFAAGDLVRCTCKRGPLLAYCWPCDGARRVERAGDRRLCSDCGRELAACLACRRLLVRNADGSWFCPGCRVVVGFCRHRIGDESCRGRIPIVEGRADCPGCGRPSVECPVETCHGLVPLLEGLHSVDCVECRTHLSLCSNRRCRAVFVAEAEDAACPVCGEPLLACPTPGCSGVVAVEAAGHCDLCGESYRLCRRGECLTASGRMANYCRRCGEALAGPDPEPAPPPVATLDFRHQILGWVDLAADFDERLASHVRGLVVGGRPFFTLPTGIVVVGGHDPIEGTRVDAVRVFDEGDFASKKDILCFPPRALVVALGDVRHRYLLAPSWRRIAAVSALGRPVATELIDVRRYHGDDASLVGPPIVRGADLIVATRKGGPAPALAVDRFRVVSDGRTIEAHRVDGRVLVTPESTFLGPVEVWNDRALVLGGRTLFRFDLDPEAGLASEERGLAGEGGVLVGSDVQLPGRLVDADVVFGPGNPSFVADRVVFFGPEPTAAGGQKTYSFYHLGREASGQLRLVQAVRGVTENQVRFVALNRRGALHVLFLWRRGLHLHDLVGGLRTLEVDAAFDPASGPAVHGDLVACRVAGSRQLGFLRIDETGGALRLAHAATLDLGEAPAVSGPVFDGSRVHILHVDPRRPRRLAIGRGELRTPAPVL